MIPVLLLLLLCQAETAVTAHYEVVSTYREPAYAKEYAEAIEAAYGPMLALLGRKVDEPGRYRIHLFARTDEYKAKDLELNKGRFAGNFAFSHRTTGESYLVLQPRSGAPVTDRVRAVARHEAFHLMVYRHAPWLDRAPAWLHEGMCERAAEGSETGSGSTYFSEAIILAKTQVAEKRFVPLATLLGDDGSDDANADARSAWYTASWLIVKHLLEKRPDAWKKFLEGLAKGGEADAAPDKVRDLLVQATGLTVDGLEKEWTAWIASLKTPAWWRISGDWRLTASGVEGAAAWGQSAYLISTAPLAGERYRIAVEARVGLAGAGQADIVVAPPTNDHNAPDLFKVCVTRLGFASVLARKKGTWSTLAYETIDPARVPADKWIKLELSVEGRTIRFQVDGFKAIEHTVADADIRLADVKWGVGNYDSCTAFRAMVAK